MTKEQKEEFKKDINLQIKELTKEIKELKSSVYPNRGEGTSDKVAHISFKQEQSVIFQRLEEATKRLNRLKQAYLKIDTPDYGICQGCEEDIPINRLKLRPESIYCVECMIDLGL